MSSHPEVTKALVWLIEAAESYEKEVTSSVLRLRGQRRREATRMLQAAALQYVRTARRLGLEATGAANSDSDVELTRRQAEILALLTPEAHERASLAEIAVHLGRTRQAVFFGAQALEPLVRMTVQRWAASVGLTDAGEIDRIIAHYLGAETRVHEPDPAQSSERGAA